MIPERVYNILFNLLPMIILFILVMVYIRVITVLYSKEKVVLYEELKKIVYLVYLFAFFWLVTSNDFISVSNNFIPFKEIMRYKLTSKLFYRNVIGNIVLFLPFGFIITDEIREKANKINVFITTLIVLLTSTSIEVIQMFIGRSFDIDDIILNVVGGIFGYIAFKIIHFISNKINSDIIKLLLFVIAILVCIIIFLLLYEVI